MYQKIHSVIHVGKNLLIVGYSSSIKWEFRIVNSEGKIVQEKNEFDTAQEAFNRGKLWIEDNLF